MTSAASVVAYYGEKPGDLQNLIGETQECVGGAPGGHFCPGDRHEACATIIGLETAKPGARMGDLLQHLVEKLGQAMTIQVGGFAAQRSYGLTSRKERQAADRASRSPRGRVPRQLSRAGSCY